MLKLDVGCGGRGTRWAGFIGIDLLPRPDKVLPGNHWQLDFVNSPLPWQLGTVDEIVALHVIEHLTRENGRRLIMRCLWLLKAGGICTITCPDLRLICRRYLERDEKLFNTRHTSPNRPIRWPGPTLADKLNWIIHCYGHKWAYDLESLTVLAREGGVRKIEPIQPGNRYYTRVDHECGIVIEKTGDENLIAERSEQTQELERRLWIWQEREKKPCAT